jgi:D-tyrosyl-tRNA(Tyr) deacylase
MIAVIQRVSKARVEIDKNNKAEIGEGLLILLGITHDDSAEDN